MRHPVPAVLAVLLVSGCAGAEAGEDVGDDGPVAYVQGTPAGGDAALLEGRVDFGGDCFVVVDGSGSRLLPVFARDEVRLDGDRLLYAGGSFGDGDAVRLGGSGSPAPSEDDHVPDGCGFDAVWRVAPQG